VNLASCFSDQDCTKDSDCIPDLPPGFTCDTAKSKCVNPSCCGCPSWANLISEDICVAGNNPQWVNIAEPFFSTFNDACGTAYSFAFDDTLKTFTCGGISNKNNVGYTITFCFDKDSDNDGIPNDRESGSSATTTSTLTRQNNEDLNDPDGDGHENSLDLDSDGDCIYDILEGGGMDVDRDSLVDDLTDTNGNGLADIVEEELGGVPLPIPDTDNDGTPDFLDRDSDNDGVADTNETIGGLDVDGDGIHDDSEDLNGDGVADSCELLVGVPVEFLDSDGDGISDHLDSVDKTGGGGGCSVASVGTTSSIPLYLLVPVFIVVRRAWKLYK